MEYIKYKEKQLPIHFGLKTLAVVSEKRDIDFGEIVTSKESLTSMSFIAEVAKQGLNDGARRDGDIKNYSVDDVWDMFDDEPSMIVEITNIFGQAIEIASKKLGSLNPTDKKK